MESVSFSPINLKRSPAHNCCLKRSEETYIELYHKALLLLLKLNQIIMTIVGQKGHRKGSQECQLPKSATNLLVQTHAGHCFHRAAKCFPPRVKKITSTQFLPKKVREKGHQNANCLDLLVQTHGVHCCHTEAECTLAPKVFQSFFGKLAYLAPAVPRP